MIPDNIQSRHIIEALEHIDLNGVPPRRIHTKYLVEHEGKFYPPKYVLSIANLFANRIELKSHDFSGGNMTNAFLKNCGFKIVRR